MNEFDFSAQLRRILIAVKELTAGMTMSDPAMPKVAMHDILNKIDAEGGKDTQDFRLPSARTSEQGVAGRRSSAPQQQENEYSRMGGLMLAIFPNGVNLASEEDFATFYLYARVVEHVSRFGQREMKDREAIHGVAMYSAMLENRVILHR
jgi:hypothetical protein